MLHNKLDRPSALDTKGTFFFFVDRQPPRLTGHPPPWTNVGWWILYGETSDD